MSLNPIQQQNVERCCVVAVDALDQKLPYLGGTFLTRADRPVSATIFF
ncbi:hypothetical protein [Comamonas sp. C11]|nr:hypothetical protein [Comamonas sp. C11]UUC91426.1 hypothetical protein NOX35_13935 [Comamonas sp. C11]